MVRNQLVVRAAGESSSVVGIIRRVRTAQGSVNAHFLYEDFRGLQCLLTWEKQLRASMSQSRSLV